MRGLVKRLNYLENVAKVAIVSCLLHIKHLNFLIAHPPKVASRKLLGHCFPVPVKGTDKNFETFENKQFKTVDLQVIRVDVKDKGRWFLRVEIV